MLVVDDHRRHRVDAVIDIKPFLRADFRGIRIRRQNLLRPRKRQSNFVGQSNQHRVRTDIRTIGEVSAEQCMFQRRLAPFNFRPMQQAMCIECVLDPVAFTENESQCRAARADIFAIRRELLRRRPVFQPKVFGDILPFRRHVGIQFERLKMNLGAHFTVELVQRLLKRHQPDDAPRA